MQEVDAIESEIRQMQSELAEVEELLSSPQTLPKHKEEKLKVAPQGGVKYFIPSSSRKMFSLEFLNEGAFAPLCPGSREEDPVHGDDGG